MTPRPSRGGRPCLVGVGERVLRKRELEGDLAAQFVSCVRGEAPVGFGEALGCGCRQSPTARSARDSRWMRPGSTVYLSRDEAGHGGLGDDPVGDADARVGGLQHRRLMQVYPRVGEHLVGHLAAAGRVGEVREPVAAQAAGERQQRGDLRLTVRRALAWPAAARQQVPAGRVRRLERGRLACRLNAFLNSRGEVVGSGKLGTPCERMQSANLTASCCACWIWAWVGWPPELDELDELEPQAAITVAAAIAAAAIGRLEVVLNMTQVVAGCRSHECNTPALTGER